MGPGATLGFDLKPGPITTVMGPGLLRAPSDRRSLGIWRLPLVSTSLLFLRTVVVLNYLTTGTHSSFTSSFEIHTMYGYDFEQTIETGFMSRRYIMWVGLEVICRTFLWAQNLTTRSLRFF
jgi:hypothetical protein